MDATLPYNEQNLFQVFWQHRERLLSGILAGGETSLTRVLGLLAAHERRFSLNAGSRPSPEGEVLTGDATWEPVEPAPADAAFTPLPDGQPLYAWAGLAGCMTVRPHHASYDHLIVPLLRELMRRRNFDAVVELGSGFGDKLLQLYLAGAPRAVPYFGAELWEPGRRMASTLAALEPDLDFRSVAFDMARPDFSFLAGHRNVLMFSNCAIYAVSALPRGFVAAMAAAAMSVTGVHFEIIGHQLPPQAPYLADFPRAARARAFNDNFIPLLLAADRDRKISIDFLAGDLHMISSGHPITVAMWHSRREETR